MKVNSTNKYNTSKQSEKFTPFAKLNEKNHSRYHLVQNKPSNHVIGHKATEIYSSAHLPSQNIVTQVCLTFHTFFQKNPNTEFWSIKFVRIQFQLSSQTVEVKKPDL